MNWTRATRWMAIVVVMGVVVISGPIVSTVDFTTASSDYDNRGTASIEIVSPPSDSARIAPGRFGTGYYFFAPDITIHLNTVRGTPTLVYAITLPGISQNFAKLVFLERTDEGRTLTVTIGRLPVPEYKLESDSYRGDLNLRVRSANDTRTVFRQNITVGVQNTDGN